MVWYMGLWRGTVLRYRSIMNRQAKPFSRDASADAGSSKHKKRTNGHWKKQISMEMFNSNFLSLIVETMIRWGVVANLAVELWDSVTLSLVKANSGPHALIFTVIPACPTLDTEKNGGK